MSSQLLAETIHSYVDPNGVVVLTNLGTRRSGNERQIMATAPVAGANFIPLIRDYSSQYGLDENLVKAIIQVESDFDPTAISPKDCKGLMQLHPDTAKRFGVGDVFNPAENIEGGVRYLSYLMDSFEGDLDHVLAAYNAGENAVKRFSGIPPYRETQAYVRKVKTLYKPSEAEVDSSNGKRGSRVYLVQGEDGAILLTNTP